MSVVAFAPAALEPTVISTDLTEAEARRLVTNLRRDFAAVVDGLAAAFTGRAWIALGHASWQAFVVAELGDALQGLSDALRQDVIGALSDTGMSARAITPLVGFKSDQSTRRVLKVVRPDGVSAPRLGADGKVYARSAASAQAVAAARPLLALPGPVKQLTATDYIASRGEDGTTVPELMKKYGWTWSQASACASRLNRALDEAGIRTIERLAQRRDGHALYVVPGSVAERQVLEPGQRIARSVHRNTDSPAPTPQPDRDPYSEAANGSAADWSSVTSARS